MSASLAPPRLSLCVGVGLDTLGLTRKAEPGGYLQWDELDWAGRRIVRADPSLPQEDMQKLLDYVSIWEDALGPKSYEAHRTKQRRAGICAD